MRMTDAALPGRWPEPRTCRVLAWGLAAVMAATVCYSLVRIPLQVTDSLVPMLDAQHTPSVAAAMIRSAGTTSYLRPLRAAQIQALFELSNGHYFLAYKGFHVLLVMACFALFVLVVDAGVPARVAALPFALTVLTGLHTFRGTVWEAYPVNHSLEVVGFCLLALVLCQSRGGRWADAGAALIFLAASLTVESGLLVWVVVATAWLCGARGVSTRGLLVVTALLAGYLWFRFDHLATGVPALSERSSGFGLRQLDPGEIMRRFGERPYVFYAYNVASSFLSVLFSEPRAGIWTIPAELARGRVAAGTAINVAASTVTTLLIAWFVAGRRHAWRQRRFERDDQIVVVALAVVLANAVISYGYTKDEILGPGGAFYSLAAFVALAAALQRAPGLAPRRPTLAAAWGLVLALTSCAWVERAIGLHYQMNLIAFYDRNEWVYVDDWLRTQQAAPATDAGRALVGQLREEALEGASVNPYLLSPRLDQWFR